jgi:hypothetical protein
MNPDDLHRKAMEVDRPRHLSADRDREVHIRFGTDVLLLDHLGDAGSLVARQRSRFGGPLRLPCARFARGAELAMVLAMAGWSPSKVPKGPGELTNALRSFATRMGRPRVKQLVARDATCRFDP